MDIGLKGLKCAFMQGFGQKGVQVSCRGGPTVERSQQKLMPPGQLVFHVWPRLSSSIENRQFNKRKVNIQCGCCTVEYLSVK